MSVVVWPWLAAATVLSAGCGSLGARVPGLVTDDSGTSEGSDLGPETRGGDARQADESDGGPSSDVGDSDAPLEPIRIYRGDPGPSSPYDLRLVGSGFDLLEGAVVTFRIGSPTSSYKLGVGQARISGGGFDVLFPAVMERIYKSKVVLIDSNRSGGCDDGDEMWTDAALYQMDMTLPIKPGDIRFRKVNSRSCSYYFADWPLE